MTTPAEMTPAEIDGQLSELWAKGWTIFRELDWYRKNLASRHPVSNGAERLAELEAQHEAIQAEAAPLEAEYARRPWKRYFLVTNTGGHVHRGRDCSTCFFDTGYAWLVELADCDEAAMVAEWGERACTVCFPEAPTHPGFGDGTSAYARRTQAEKDARAAELEAKRQAKAAKQLTTPVKGEYETIRTVAAAQQALREEVKMGAWGYPNHPNADLVARLEAALTEKGVTREALDTLKAKALKAAKA